EPAWLPPHEPALPHGDRCGLLRARVPAPRACAAARDRGRRHHVGCRGRRLALRDPPAPCRIRRLGDRAPRRRLRALLRADAPRLPEDGRDRGGPPLYAYTMHIGWGPLASVLGGAIVVAATWRRWPALAAATVTYVALLFPVLGVFAAGPQAVGDRYSYLACLGWALLAGGAVA